MKKAIAMIALAAICFGTTAYAVTPVKAKQDTTKTKTKTKTEKKKAKKDTTKM
jgi:hypothetical protein